VRVDRLQNPVVDTSGILTAWKPLNLYVKKLFYENEEFNLLQAALNIEDSLEDLAL
jgi:hypothetical protein